MGLSRGQDLFFSASAEKYCKCINNGRQILLKTKPRQQTGLRSQVWRSGMVRNTTKLCVALFAWILLLHPQDLHAVVCIEKHLNSTATALSMNMTILKYKVECLIPHGAVVIIKGRKTYKEDKVRVQIQNQSLILSSDQHPASCRLIWTDSSGRKRAENCTVTQDADLSVADRRQTSTPTETHVEISSVGSGRKMRARLNIVLYSIIPISIFGILVLYNVLKKICKKHCPLSARHLESSTTSNSSELLMVDHRVSNARYMQETASYNMLDRSQTWHGNSSHIVGTARSGSAAAALLLDDQTDAYHTWHAGCKKLWPPEELDVLTRNPEISDWQEEYREEQSDPDS